MSYTADLRQDLLRRENCARDDTERDTGDRIEDGLNGVLSHSSTQLIQPVGFPFLDQPVDQAFCQLASPCFSSLKSIFEFFREFESHALALLEIDLESSFDGVGDGLEDSSRAVKFFIGCDDLKSFVAVLDNFLGR